jgi:GGDEF domain-containing protein
MSQSGPPVERLARAARAAHDLSDALWEALHEELAHDPPVERAAALAQRLADVCSSIALLAAKPQPAAPLGASSEPHPQGPAETSPEPPVEMPLEPAETPLEPPEPSVDAGIEIHDTRGDDEPARPAGWIGSIARRLERHREDRLPFAVLLIEIAGIERLAHAEPREEIARLTDHAERAISAELRPADLLTRESLGRYWLVTPETDAAGARHLAERLARTVRLSARHRGVPLELAMGIAICPDDGRDAAVLAAHADVGVYAARAAGQPFAPADDPAA